MLWGDKSRDNMIVASKVDRAKNIVRKDVGPDIRVVQTVVLTHVCNCHSLFLSLFLLLLLLAMLWGIRDGITLL